MNWIKAHWQKIEVTLKLVKEFGFILSGFLIVAPAIVGVLKWHFANEPFHYWLGWPVFSVLVLILNFALPSVVAVIFRCAMMFGHAVSAVLMRVILAVLFYLVFTPMSLIARMIGKDLLDQKLDPGCESYWQRRPAQPPKEQYERMF